MAFHLSRIKANPSYDLGAEGLPTYSWQEADVGVSLSCDSPAVLKL